MTDVCPAGTRRRARLVCALASAVLWLIVVPRPAFACECAEPAPPEEARSQADVVFAGEVTETRILGDELTGDLVARLSVDAVWKGEVPETVEVRTATDTAMCGYPFTPGSRDLVYAHEADDGSFSTHLCTRSGPVDRADEDLAALGDGTRPVAGELLIPSGRPWPWLAVIGAAVLTAVAVTWRIRRSP